MPTPQARDGEPRGPADPVRRRAGGHQVNLNDAVDSVVKPGQLLPTPTAADSRSAAIQTVRNPGRPIPAGCVTLTDSVRLLPTPTASDAKNCTHTTHDGGPSPPDRARALSTPTSPTHGMYCAATQTPGEGKEGFVAVFPRVRGALLPTPTAHDGSSNGISATSRQGGPSLLDSLRLLPTPRATDGTKGCPAQRGSKGDLMLPSVVIAVTTPKPKPRAEGGE
ncbi:hypothetical protein [Amycolatopsis magusensis]|uniref:hypothetical protein n=1 Tax=Amycolatopsis magusensis TaxID=882444 RepID=UPI0024A844B5|nr:hypothetical protein [Amycolatopsis magusensis]MDI5976466.1 hypothetical protein [Amycolatopsis magusensis]